jgi:DNA-binding NarL/FixJ family response regulator
MSALRRSPLPSKMRVFIVDDHAVFRTGLRRLLIKEKDLEVCGEAGTPDEVFKALPTCRPDVILMDLSLEGVSGIDVTRRVHEQYPQIPILVVSMHKESIYAGQALKAGATGYIMKNEAPDRLLRAVRQVIKGEVHVSPEIVSDLLRRLPRDGNTQSPVECLSARELQVFRMIGEGKGTRQIAELLGLSVKTVESYRAHIKEKMSFDTSYQLVRAAIFWSQEEKQL